MRLYIDSSIRANPRTGVAISAALHAALVLIVFLAFTQPTPSQPKPQEIPVEVVPPPKTPPKNTEKTLALPTKATPKKVETKPPKVQTAEKVPPKPPEPTKAEKAKAPEKSTKSKSHTAAKKPEAAEKPEPSERPKPPEKAEKAQKPAPQVAARPPETTPKAKPIEPAPFAPIPAPPPIARSVPQPPPPKPLRPRASARTGVKVPSQTDGVPLPSAAKGARYGRWVLKPLVVNTGHQCGAAGITGSIRLTKKQGNRYIGSLRTTIRWSRCKPEGALYKIVLLIRGQQVTMLDSGGVLDRGTIRGNTMVLRDAYGASTWRRVQ